MSKKNHKNKINGSTKTKHSIDRKSIVVGNSTSNRKHDIWTAILTILGLIVVHLTIVFHSNEVEPLRAYLVSQADVGCFYANSIALVSATYGKATGDFDVKGRVYLLSICGNFLVAHIFAQAIFMVYPGVKLYAEFMRTEWFALLGVLMLFGIIFAINCSEGKLEYTKETLTKKK